MAGYTALGAAVAVADYDNDGFEDIFVTDSKVDGKNHLYHNNGDGMFTDVTELHRLQAEQAAQLAELADTQRKLIESQRIDLSRGAPVQEL